MMDRSAPVALAPWEAEPYKLVSLREILMPAPKPADYDYEGEFIVGLFTNLLFFLGSLDEQLWVNTPAQKFQISLHAKEAAKLMEEKWGLRVAAGHTRELAETLEEIATKGDRPIGTASIHDQVTLIRSALHIELETTVFVYVPTVAAVYYRTPLQDVTEDVQKRFSSTLYDFAEAAKCYALSRSTACVSHCMRVLEVGLDRARD